MGGADQIGRLTSSISTPDTGAGNAIYGSTGDGLMLTPDKLQTTITTSGGNITTITTTRTPQASFEQPYTNQAGSDYFSANAAYKTTTPDGVGVTRTTQTQNGFVGGLADQVNGAGNTFTTRIVGNSGPGDVTLDTNAATNRAGATVAMADWDNGISATFRLGGTTSNSAATSAFIDDKTYAMRDRPADIGNTTTIGGSGVGITSNTVMVSYNTAPVPTLFSNAGVTPCTCAFLTWGWWGGDVKYGSGAAYNAGRRDRLNLGTYVAGTLSTANDINLQTGIATYKGHLVGNVNNNGSSYVQAGTYQNVWNFGSRNGAATVNFDGRTYGGPTTVNTVMTGGQTFGTNGTPIASGDRSLTLNGAFMSGGPGKPVAGQAGNFAINSTTGPSYKAGGTFAAQK